MRKITNVVAITPVFREPAQMVLDFHRKMLSVRDKLLKQGVQLTHHFLNDGADDFPALYAVVKHDKNMGLARTLVDGYKTVIAKPEMAGDIVIRLDVQEHDPWKTLEIVDCMEYSSVGALFLPVYYWVEGELRPSMRDVQKRIVEFNDALEWISPTTVLSTYNQVFPLGYQAFRIEVLRKLVPQLEKGLKICEELTGKPATWGLDLLAILLTAKMGVPTDSFFGGWSTPWKENRTFEHLNAQREKARVMIEVARRLGCKVRSNCND